RELIAARRVAAPLARLPVLAVDLGDPPDRREDHEVREAAPGGPLDRLGAALGGAPDGRVRPLQRARPGVDERVAVEPAVERKRPRLGPGAEDQLRRLVEPLA